MIRLSVIVPVYNGGAAFDQCLRALRASSRSADEVIVVDDASTDDSGASAQQWGARVLRLNSRPRGPAAARNLGAAEATGDALVFLDADVAVHPDTLARIATYLEAEPEVAALFGSYDDAPPAAGLVTRYKNLLHHYVHQHGRREASTFWAGCGAIRRQVFLDVDGFDERYHRPCIEDIELGVRLRDAGYRIALCPEIQVTHLKRWTLRSWLEADIFGRAIPWTRLIVNRRRLPADLNVDWRSRLSAGAIWLMGLSAGLGLRWPVLWAVTGLAASLFIGLNWDLSRFFLSHGGLLFAAGAICLHALYLLYSSALFVLVGLIVWAGRQNERDVDVTKPRTSRC